MSTERERPAASRNTYKKGSLRLVIAVGLMLGLLAVFASSSSVAAPTWLDPESLSAEDGYPVDSPQIGLDSAGNALAVWWAEQGDQKVIMYAERMSGGKWGTPEYISTGVKTGEYVDSLQLVVDAEGKAVALWRHRYKYKWRIAVTIRDAGGQWSSTRYLSPKAYDANTPRVAISGGNIVATWTAASPPPSPPYSVIVARVRATGGVWGNDQVLSEVGDQAYDLQVAVNDAGNAVLAWTLFTFTDNKTNVRASYYSPGSGWSQPSVGLLPASVSMAFACDADIDEAGNSTVIWREFDFDDFSWHIRSAYRLGDDWGVVDDIFGGAQDVYYPMLKVDGRGSAVAVWSHDDGISKNIYAVDHPTGGSWDEPTVVATFDEGDVYPRHQLAVNAAGDAIVVWVTRDGSGSGYGIYSVTRSADSDRGGERSGWTEPVVVDGGVSIDPINAGIAIDREGNSVTTWADNIGAPVIRAAAHDVAGPRIVGLNIPATGTVGVPVNFSTSSLNTWGITSTSWSFGDGRQAMGQSVAHTYTLPGTYRVQAAAADLVGSDFSESRTVTISRSVQEPELEPGPSSKPEFKVKLSNDGRGKRTSVKLNLSTRGRYIKKVRFGLPRYMKFSTKRLGKKKRFGSVKLVTKKGELETSLSLSQSVRAKRKKKKAIRFSSKGALNDLKVSLFKRKVGTKKVRIRTKSGKKKTLKRSVLKSRLSFKSLPKQDIKGLRVELNPSESRFLRNPKGCKKPLKFLAFVTTSDGKRHVVAKKIKLKGKGCSKKKSKKSK